MGIFDRLGDIAEAVVDFGEESFGLVRDLAGAAWDGDEEGGDGGLYGFLKALQRASIASTRAGGGVKVAGANGRLRSNVNRNLDVFEDRGGDEQAIDKVGAVYRKRVPRLAETAIGPEGVGGQLVGSVPGFVRQPARGALEKAEQAGSEARETVSALLTGGMLALDPEYVKTLKDNGNPLQQANELRRRAMQIAETRSVGQSAYLTGWAVANLDVPTEDEVSAILGTELAENLTGIIDLGGQLFLDPTVALGKVAKVGKLRYLAKPVTPKLLREAVENTQQIDKVFDFISKAENASVVRDRLFNNITTRTAPTTATALWEAAQDGRETFNMVFRAGAGDNIAQKALTENRNVYADKLATIENLHRQYTSIGYDMRVAVDAAEELYPSLLRAERATDIYGTIRELPRLTKAGAVRTRITASDFYQKDQWSRPLRVIFDDMPAHHVALDDPTGDGHLWRQLNAANTAVPLEVKQQLRAAYMATNEPGLRGSILQQADETIVKGILAEEGLPAAMHGDLIELMREDKLATRNYVRERAYAGQAEHSIVRIADDDGVVKEVHLPAFVTQTEDYFTFSDLDAVRGAAKELATGVKRHNGLRYADEARVLFNTVWKPAVLFRVGWPVKVVSDEQLRILSKISMITQGKQITRQVRGKVHDTLKTMDDDTYARMVRRNPDLVSKEEAAKVLKGVPGVYRRAVTTKAAPGVEFDSLVGPIDEAPNQYLGLASSRGTIRSLAGADEESKVLDRLRKQNEAWVTRQPGESGYDDAYIHAVNNQLGNDKLARRLMSGELTVEDVPAWLTFDPVGVSYAAKMPKARMANKERYAETVDGIINSLLPNEALRAKALKRTVTKDDLITAIPEIRSRPPVNGALIDDALTGKSNIGKFLEKTTDKLWAALGSGPSDFFSRHPFADAMYRAEIDRLATLAADTNGGVLDSIMIPQIQAKAREYALGETRRVLFNLAEQSRIAEYFRFVAPFANASKEVMTRWAGIAVDNPAYVARLRVLWNSPEKAGVVYDENGNRWNSDGSGVAPDGTRVPKSKMGGDKRVVMQLPEWASDVPVIGALFEQPIAFDKNALNMITGNPFGAGPFVQIPVNQIVKRNPTLADSVKFILPYGVTNDSIIKQLLPTVVKRASTGQDDASRSGSVLRIWYDQITKWREDGEDGPPPTFADAQKREEKLWNLKQFAGLLLPVSIQTLSPYQHHVNLWRQLNAEDPDTAEDKFLEMAGEEYEALTMSVTKSNDGVSPTDEAFGAAGPYRDLIQKFGPIAGRVITGDIGGSYSQAVSKYQMRSTLGPGSDVLQRQPLPFAEAAARAETDPIWRKFTNAMDLIDATLSERGLDNIDAPEAKDLKVIKKAIIESLRAKSERWYFEYSDGDPAAKANKLRFLRQIAKTNKLKDRPDLAPLAAYFEARDLFSKVLAERDRNGGSKTLDAEANTDLQVVWGLIVGRLKEQNPAYALLHNRLLEYDAPEAA